MAGMRVVAGGVYVQAVAARALGAAAGMGEAGWAPLGTALVECPGGLRGRLASVLVRALLARGYGALAAYVREVAAALRTGPAAPASSGAVVEALPEGTPAALPPAVAAY